MKKTLVGFIALLSLSIGLWCGCKATLAPGGAYAPTVFTTNATTGVITTNQMPSDMAFYITESTFILAASTIDTAFRFERDNRAALWKLSPDIKHTLDKIRPDATQAVNAYAAARKVYMANPTPAGLDMLNTIMAKAQQIASAAAAAVKVTNPTK